MRLSGGLLHAIQVGQYKLIVYREDMPSTLSLIVRDGLWAQCQLVSSWKHTRQIIVQYSAAGVFWSQPNLLPNLRRKLVRTLRYKKVTRDQRWLCPESTIYAVIPATGLYSPRRVRPTTNHGEIDSSAMVSQPTSWPKFNTGKYHRIIDSSSMNTALLTPIVYHCNGGRNCKTTVRYKVRLITDMLSTNLQNSCWHE
jgi:hypothetical protein